MNRHSSARRAVLGACVATLAAAAPAAAQQITASLLPDTAAERLVEFHNMETTTRLSGDARIGPGTVMRGGVAVLGGSLTVEGAVDGDVVVINGDLLVLPGGSIAGRATVAGGEVAITPPGSIAGVVRVYREPLRYRHLDGVIAYVPPDLEEGLSTGRDFAFGRTEIQASSYGAYNRAEGLPVAAGPLVRFGGTHPINARALLIARTAVPRGLDRKRLGYDVRVEQLTGPDLGLSLGARLISVIAPIEEWGLTDRESALATFVLHNDYRDHYEREGWSVYARLARPGTPWTLQLEYMDEEHERTPIANPVVLFRTDTGWRPEASIAEGALRSLTASLRYDTRNEERDPSAGWLIDARLEQGLGGTLINHGSFDQETRATVSRTASSSFLTGHVDLRRYARLSP
ncbi:MAG TPA: hypothetical protein VHG09_03865, partial [Longimicrobiales bacterium]|nr:hypothetical protein [Longimicrobiales bacterium]